MRKFKSLHEPGHAYFVTIVIADKVPIFELDAIPDIIIENLNFYRNKYKFRLLGYVIMPEHIHLIIFPSAKGNISEIMRDFKKYTSIKIIESLKQNEQQGILKIFSDKVKNKRNRKYQVWEEEFFDKNVFTEKFFQQKLDYIHNNPVRRGLVINAVDYKYSSYRNYALNDHSIITIDDLWEEPELVAVQRRI